MQTDWIWGFGGGLLIGVAASVYLLFNGRIMGASGIFGGLVDGAMWGTGWGSGWGSWAERLAFTAGLVGIPTLITRIWPSQTHLTGNWLVIIAGGLLVGLGTRLANGCTSGHGVCGMSRLSARSIVATLVYILAGVVTIALLRHVWGVI